MKKMILTMAVALMISGSVFAQSENAKRQTPPSKEQIAERMTEGMVKHYGLNDTQKTALLKLNKEYAEKMPMRMGRPGGPRGQRPSGEGFRPDSTQQRQRPSKEEMDKRMEEMKKVRDAYDSELKKILTDDQYKQYQTDQKNRGPRGPRGNKSE